MIQRLSAGGGKPLPYVIIKRNVGAVLVAARLSKQN